MKAINGSIKSLIDQGWKLNQEIKEKNKLLNAIKKKLKAIAKQKNKFIFKGSNAFVTINNKNETTIDPYKLYKFMKSKKKEKKFFNCISINVIDVRDSLGEDFFDIPGIDIKTKEFNGIKFEPIKKGK